jgi:uncharacterized membrane protein
MGDSLVRLNQPANMDGVVHMTNIAIFHNALSNGDFPVRWTGQFANYGLPMGSFAQQFTSYLGALLTFITHNVIISYSIVLWIGTFLSLYFFYLFLRHYYSELAALTGSVLFNFTNYRIINAHIRGALPEYFSTVFVALLLLGLIELIQKSKIRGFFICTFATWGLILTHPMNVVTSLVLIVPFTIWLLWQSYRIGNRKEIAKKIAMVCASVLLGVTAAAYYIIPLLHDIQYFYYGQSSNHYNSNQELTIRSFIETKWYYDDIITNNILSRGHVITVGSIETLLLFVGLGIFITRTALKKKIELDLLSVSLLTALLSILLVTKAAAPVFERVDFLSNIQFPWRILSSLMFVPPIILAYILNKSRTVLLLPCIVCIVLLLRVPQLYGKNYTSFSQEYYYETIDNLHSTNMNTVWTSDTKMYPTKQVEVEILEGDGIISDLNTSNSHREFKTASTTPLKIIVNTFYFPGWKAFIDQNEIPIEFQDINHRGVITMIVPEGSHHISVKFTATKTVAAANALSIIAIVNGIFLFVYRSRLQKLLTE